jgi:L-cystine transport system permease protein
MSFDTDFFLVALKQAILFTPNTLLMAGIPLAIGIVAGLALAAIRVFRIPFLAQIARAYVVLVKSIPLTLVLVIVYFFMMRAFDGIMQSLGFRLHEKDLDPIWIAVTALSFWAIGNISEVFRGALTSVGTGQYEAAFSVGLNRRQAFFRIVLPQALPASLPMLCNILIGLIKGSSIAFLVSAVDLLNAALIEATGNYRYLEAYVAAALVYWALTSSVEQVGFRLERRFTLQTKGAVA